MGVTHLKIEKARSVFHPGRIAVIACQGAGALGLVGQFISASVIPIAFGCAALADDFAVEDLVSAWQHVIQTCADAEIVPEVQRRTTAVLADKTQSRKRTVVQLRVHYAVSKPCLE